MGHATTQSESEGFTRWERGPMGHATTQVNPKDSPAGRTPSNTTAARLVGVA